MKAVKQLRRISVATTPEAEDAVAEMLSAALGLPASSYADSETGVSTVTVYSQRKLRLPRGVREEISAGLRRIKSCGLKIGLGKIAIARVRREDWAESWKRHFQPIEIVAAGARTARPTELKAITRGRAAKTTRRGLRALPNSLLIKPSWSKRKARAGQAVVVLDPGLSFGTGQHPTTAFCLSEIVRLQKNQNSALRRRTAAAVTVSKPHNILLAPRGTSGARNEERGIPSKNAPPRPGPLLHCLEERETDKLSWSPETASAGRPCVKPPSFLDLGTGSGILAIAAVKLGYSPVLAMDLDPEAVRIAGANARVNRVQQQLKIRRENVTKLPIRPRQRRQRYDLVCANLISDLLIAERRRITAQLNRTGTLVLAGILKPEFARVQKAFEALGLKLAASRSEKEWRSGSFRFAHQTIL